MDAGEAIAAATAFIRQANLDYPVQGLVADRFESGWSVYAPVRVDTDDPAAFLDVPVGRAAFLVGDSGWVEQVSSSTPPRQVRQRFGEDERMRARELVPSDAVGSVWIETGSPSAPDAERRDEQLGQRASAMLDPIAQQLALLGPAGWQRLQAVFALTVRGGSASCEFATEGGWQPVDVPRSIVDLVRAQREVSASMSAGPWWRLMMSVTVHGELRTSYDYGDQPFPPDQLQPAENYRDDIAAHPRPALPMWLAGYLAAPTVQGRTSAQAAAAGGPQRGVETQDIEPLPDTWARWAVLSAISAGARSQWGPRIGPGVAWYESDARSGSTLYVLPGDRAVLSGGRWNSPLLVAAYQGQRPMPDLYAGAPAWVNDTTVNTRNQNGLLSFCYWWTDGRWWRGATDTFDELDDPLPVIWTPRETVESMLTVVGPGVHGACARLLEAAAQRATTTAEVAAVFADFGDPDLDAALDQLAGAGLTG